MTVRRGRVSLRDQITASVKADAMYAALAGKPPVLAAEMPKPVQKRTNKPTGNKKETDVQAEVVAALRAHPKVAGVWKIKAGTFKDGDRYITAAPRGFPDVHFLMTDGRAGYCEVKSPTGRVMEHQQQFIDAAAANNAVAFIARCVEDVQRNVK